MSIKKAAIVLVSGCVLAFQGTTFAVADEIPDSIEPSSVSYQQSAGTLTYVDARSMLFTPASGIGGGLTGAATFCW
ncbi:hypothetical protein QS713_03245 [Gleimia hominis]|uniref:Uncharacterized protein n=1 Tax=Gleimia hominis TaxID=595468 RepID=A0ABU3I9N1_9ACTO|nr:hypothetical protein [Gleimia hominis]MDT3767083.1 hypothetical protein [Gleimia hominis]